MLVDRALRRLPARRQRVASVTHELTAQHWQVDQRGLDPGAETVQIDPVRGLCEHPDETGIRADIPGQLGGVTDREPVHASSITPRGVPVGAA